MVLLNITDTFSVQIPCEANYRGAYPGDAEELPPGARLGGGGAGQPPHRGEPAHHPGPQEHLRGGGGRGRGATCSFG